MKVKTFIGTDAPAVDKQVNAWLAKSKVQVRRTSTAFKRLKYMGKGTLAGRPLMKHGIGIAISVWYDAHTARSRISKGRSGQKRT